MAAYKNMSENEFLGLFRKENKVDAVKFMKVWDQLDKDGSGYISSAELKPFLETLGVESKKSQDITDHIVGMYDKNNDGKLGLSELSKLLQSDQNILQAFVDGENLTPEKFDEVFKFYDQDNGGSIKGCELRGFLKDMKATQDDDTEAKDLKEYEKWIMEQADENGDGELSKAELKALFFG